MQKLILDKMRNALLLLFLSFPNLIFGQQDAWNTYLAQFEKGPGSVMLNMDIIKRAPLKDLQYIVITGVKPKECDENGFPTTKEFESLYKISDSIYSTIQKNTKSELVGTFTYDCERLDYVYVKDTVNLRHKIQATYKELFSDYSSYINIRVDKEWSAYFKFLYPNEQILNYMGDLNVINQLTTSGDDLSKARQVDHWIYFDSKKDRDEFIKYIKSQSFKIENQSYIPNTKMPYQLQISRTDKVDIESINKVTQQLRELAKRTNGDYDGWETFVIK